MPPVKCYRHWSTLSADIRFKTCKDSSAAFELVLLLLALTASTAFPPQMIKSLEFPPYMSAQYCVLNEEADRTNLSQNVAFACSRADSTASYPGSSCASLTPEQNASSSFNQYFQFQNQDSHACDFQGLARITTEIPSVGNCRFIIGLVQVPPPSAATSGTNYNAVVIVTVFSILMSTLFRFV